ncbi:pleckstrin homology domain-containing family H member 3 [Engraulis encrasicolus]|uniref:pleckstrin homology domain-containing family H member 3 n=1 Tax=Engraulis encrasicolus TaxID=184585 RepID=UPI002FD0755D
MPWPGLHWCVCCRQGFNLLGREHAEKEEEESFELRNKEEVKSNGRRPLEVILSQPAPRSTNGTCRLSDVSDEMRSLIVKKSRPVVEEDPDVLVKGWLYREMGSGWCRLKRFWFRLSADSLDYSSGPLSQQTLSSLVLTSLCCVLWPDKHTYRKTGYWSLCVFGRKHCYRLFTRHFNEAMHWACAIQKVIDSKPPLETPTQTLIRDIEENKFNPEVVEHIYEHNPILRYSQSPLYAPLLPLPYGSLDHMQVRGKGYRSVREEAVRLFSGLQQLESVAEPIPLIQGLLQTCLDLPALRDELYAQAIKQTTHTTTTTSSTSSTTSTTTINTHSNTHTKDSSALTTTIHHHNNTSGTTTTTTTHVPLANAVAHTHSRNNSTHSQHSNTLVVKANGHANGQANGEPATLVIDNGTQTLSLTHHQSNGQAHTHPYTHAQLAQTQAQARAQAHAHLRYWQLLTCMSCTFLPSSGVLKHLQFHLKRVQNECVDPEVESYTWFISEALTRTRGRDCVPSWGEIQQLMRRQELVCVVHYPGPANCPLRISSHTTASQVVRRMRDLLGLQDSLNTFALFEQSASWEKQNACWEKLIGGTTIIADVLTKFENSLSAKGTEGQRRLCFKLHCLLDTHNISHGSMEQLFLYEQCHEQVLRGQLPVCEADLVCLAALRLQAQMGDLSAAPPCPPPEQLFPRSILLRPPGTTSTITSTTTANNNTATTAIAGAPDAPATNPAAPSPDSSSLSWALLGGLWGRKRREQEEECARSRLKEEAAAVMAAVAERWRGLAGLSRADCMTAYLSVMRQWAGFGSALYEVDVYVSSLGSFSGRLLLGVAASCVSLYQPGEAEPLDSFPIGQICSYGIADPHTLRISTGDRDLLLQTSQLTEIVHLMNAYLCATRRHLGKGDVTVTMETTHPKMQCNPLLQLPSHAV